MAAALSHSPALGLHLEGVEAVGCQDVCSCSEANEQLIRLIQFIKDRKGGHNNQEMIAIMKASKHTDVFEKAFKSLHPISNDAEFLSLQNLCRNVPDFQTELKRLRARGR